MLQCTSQLAFGQFSDSFGHSYGIIVLTTAFVSSRCAGWTNCQLRTSILRIPSTCYRVSRILIGHYHLTQGDCRRNRDPNDRRSLDMFSHLSYAVVVYSNVQMLLISFSTCGIFARCKITTYLSGSCSDYLSDFYLEYNMQSDTLTC